MINSNNTYAILNPNIFQDVANMVDILRFQTAIEWKAENFLRDTFSKREVIRYGGRILAVALKLTTQRIKIFSCEYIIDFEVII
jgi:hypothetical protein